MDPFETHNPKRAEEIFLDALKLPAADRPDFLMRQCGDDGALRREVEHLLQADEAAGDDEFLNSELLRDAPPIIPVPQSISSEEEASSEGARFRILRRHQQGGLGEVLIAYDRQLKRDVALKQIKPKWQMHDEARQRFVQEAEVTGRLEHPGVVPVYAMGTWDDGRHYYAMRFIEGSTLRAVITQYHHPSTANDSHQRALQLRNLLKRFVDVCDTINYAHSRQIIHRDLKPSNIMVGRYGETLVVDWGLAKLMDAPAAESLTVQYLGDRLGSGSTPTQVGGTVGTPQYMSPEQASGRLKEIGPRTDIYLLGATLYEILTGSPPHDDDSVSSLVAKVSRGELQPPSARCDGIPKPLDAICLKAMATEPEARYQSVSELANDIECWMADEPVSVYIDPITVRATRWIRRHRTVAYSGAVAAVLLTLGSLVGSAVWSYQSAQRIEAERERNIKIAELRAQRQQRLAELRTAALASAAQAEEEVRSGRYSSALGFIQGARDSIREEKQLAGDYQRLTAKADRLQRIVDFYQHADYTQEQNVLSRDGKAMIACVSGLKALGIWETDDWWFRLPTQDLSPQQQEQLRWDVYQQLMLLDAMLVKTIGTRLSGDDRLGSAWSLLQTLGRSMRTTAGETEARAALVISDRIDRFRLSESTRWYRSVAEARLRSGRLLAAKNLGVTRNAPDAQSLGVLSMIAALDPSFEIFFRDYQGDDPLIASRDLFSRASILRPQHYWSLLFLGQLEFLVAEREDSADWQKYEPAVQALGRCISLQPEKCFAYADRSSVFRAQARMLAEDDSIDDRLRASRLSELRQWSLADAQTAERYGTDQPWVGWQHGLAMFEVGQRRSAIDRFLITSQQTFPLAESEDATLVRVDDLRGRSDAAAIALELIEQNPQSAIAHVLLSTIRLNQNRVDEAIQAAQRSIALPSSPPHAWAVLGMSHLTRHEWTSAIEALETTLRLDPNHPWAHFGLARCLEQEQRFEESLNHYRRAAEIAKVDDHRAAALLGQCRTLGFLGQLIQATSAIDSALELEPASDLESVVRPLAKQYGNMFREDPNATKTLAMKQFVLDLNERRKRRAIELNPMVSESSTYRAALLNGDFELETARYWSDGSGATWLNEDGYEATATVTTKQSHWGTSSLRIRGDQHQRPTQRGRTGQTIPIEPGARYRVSIWSRAEQLEEGAIWINMTPAFEGAQVQPVLTLPSGSYPWRRSEGDFVLEIPENADSSVRRRGLMPVRMEVLSIGAGTVWLDDLQVLRIAGKKEAN